MNDVHSLLARCRAFGATLTPDAPGTFKVTAPAPLPDDLKSELKRRKTELLRLLSSPPTPTDGTPFFVDAREDIHCPACGASVQLEPARLEELPTRLWSCPSCHSWGATRDGCQFPTVWLSSRTLH